MLALLPLLVASALAVPAPSTDKSVYIQHAESAFKGLQGWYNQTSGIWNTAGWWNGANAMTGITELAAVDSNIVSAATQVFARTYQQAPSVNPGRQVTKKLLLPQKQVITLYGPASGKGALAMLPRDELDELEEIETRAADAGVDGKAWVNSCYDDNSWWALGWVGAYDITKTQVYLDTAAGIFKNNLTGAGPTNCSNGGIVWCADNYYVNAISNELYLSVAAHLANRVPADKAYYLKKAQDQWNWFKKSGMINKDNLINDGLEPDCTNTGKRPVFTYNMGVILGGLVELNRAAPNSDLINWANKLATAAIKNLTDSKHILHEPCEPNCGPDGTQFKGIFIRNLAMLHKASPSATYSQVLKANADSIWANDRVTSNNTFSVNWAGPLVAPVNASTTSSAFEGLIAAINA